MQLQIDWYYDSPSTNPAPFFPLGIINAGGTTGISWPPACGLPDDAADDYDERDALIEHVITDSINFNENADENSYKATTFAYTAMKENDTLINSTAREQFMTQTEQTNIGLFEAVNDSVATANLPEAEIINATIVDTNLIESNTKEVNSIKVNLLLYDTIILSVTDSAVLEGISNQDPLIGGKAVYEARALLHKRIIDRSMGNNLRVINDKLNDEQDWEVFPNPTSDALSIRIAAPLSIASIGFYDVTGREILFTQLTGKRNFSKLDLSSFSPGSYRLTVKTMDNIQFSKQIVLVR